MSDEEDAGEGGEELGGEELGGEEEEGEEKHQHKRPKPVTPKKTAKKGTASKLRLSACAPQPPMEEKMEGKPCGGPLGNQGTHNPCPGMAGTDEGADEGAGWAAEGMENVDQPLPYFPFQPIPTVCQREIGELMERWREELRPLQQPAKQVMRVFMRDLKKQKDEDEPLTPPTLSGEMRLLELEIELMKHELAVRAIRKKYGVHAPSCPCEKENPPL